MPNFELPNDAVTTIPILTQNAVGVSEPPPAGDVFTVVSSNPASLNAVIGQTSTGIAAVVMNALVAQSPGLSVIVSDSAGLTTWTQVVDIVEDVTATNVVLDLANATHTTQPVPTAPGP